MLRTIKLLIKYMGDKRAPIIKKLLFIGSALYMLLPVDIVPDFIIGVGWLDDIAVLIFIWNAIRQELKDYSVSSSIEKLRKAKVINIKKKDRK
ncbi:MAG: YkvA family protein [Bacillota bacterium]